MLLLLKVKKKELQIGMLVTKLLSNKIKSTKREEKNNFKIENKRNEIDKVYLNLF